jgi:hypothetical protein
MLWFPSFQHVAIAIMMVLFSLTTTTAAASTTNIEEILDQLGWEGLIGQLGQIDIGILLHEERTKLDENKIKHYIGKLGIGSVLNNVGLIKNFTHFGTLTIFGMPSFKSNQQHKHMVVHLLYMD